MDFVSYGEEDTEELVPVLKALASGQQRLEAALERVAADVERVVHSQEAISMYLHSAGAEPVSSSTEPFDKAGTGISIQHISTEMTTANSYSMQRVSSNTSLPLLSSLPVQTMRSSAASSLRPRRFDMEGQGVRRSETHRTVRRAQLGWTSYLLHLASSLCLAKDVCGMLILLADLLLVPFLLAWSLETRGFLLAAAWTSVVFWTLDLTLSFFRDAGSEQSTLRMGLDVTYRYVRTWLLVDAVLLACDWVALILELRARSEGKVGELQLVLGLLRTSRLARAGKIWYAKHLFHIFNHQIWARFALGNRRIAIRVLHMVFVGMVMNHWCCCIWFAISRHSPSDSGTSWLIGYGYEDAAPLTQYLVSFQWAVAHMFGGEPAVNPTKSAEMVFAIVDLVIGVLFGSYLISTIASMMIEVNMARDKQVKQREEVLHFLDFHQVDLGLSVQVLSQVKNRSETKRKPKLKDVPSLSSLPPGLLSELQYHLFAKHMLCSDFLCLCDHADEGLVKELCSNCVEHLQMTEQDELFAPNQPAKAAYILVAGSFKYEVKDHCTEHSVPLNTWLAEQGLFTFWQYRGWTEALTLSEVVSINTNSFATVVGSSSRVGALVQSFARAICLHFGNLPNTEWTDLPLDQDALLLTLPREPRISISQAVLSCMEDSQMNSWAFWHKRKGLADLKAEVEKGACLLKANCDGQFTRMTSIVVLDLQSRGKQLINMGELDVLGSQLPRVRCELPATKVLAGERLEDALERMIAQDLTMLGGVAIQSQSTKIVESASASYGLHTKYFRTVFQATLESEERDRSRQLSVSRSLSMQDSRSGRALARSGSMHWGEGEAWDPEREHMPLKLCSLRSHKTVPVYAWLEKEELERAKACKEGVRSWLAKVDWDSESEQESEECQETGPRRARSDDSNQTFVAL